MQDDNYLDVKKSIMISSPAGSGKTEKLARRYIALLEGATGGHRPPLPYGGGLISGSPEVEKILCITFTEKAAAEMKGRILRILQSEKPALYGAIRDKIPLMRISTIHSFCLRLLKRFSIELGLDPSLSVAEEHTARTLWFESIYEELMAERESPSLFFRMIKERGIRGWDSLMRLLDELYKKRPYTDMLLEQAEVHQERGPWPSDAFSLFRQCLNGYQKKKKERHVLDFDDLEALAYKALCKSPEWQNILYAFDEHTDHILVDEFQDTSTLQWKLIEKLTEEWRSGMGSKREAGATPTLFLVGDEKQSIYRFRGANVSVFTEARDKLSTALGDEFDFIQVKENFRSLPEIVEFTNSLFSKLMPPELLESYRTRYSPFMAVREGKGSVELLLLESGDEHTKECRMKEANALARLINSLNGRLQVYEGQTQRPCGYLDMAVLLRRRTHLGLFEDAFRQENIPFVVLKGIGFYDEPETALLREVVSFIVDPTDNYALFCLLRSPLFSVNYKTLHGLLKKKGALIANLKSSKAKRLKDIASELEEWLLMSAEGGSPLARLIEYVLTRSGGWLHFWERQRHANMKKFIALIEQYESGGASPIEIRDKLLRQRHASEVSRANINAEGMNAVKIMTIHAAKGLQFPMVFIPSLEESPMPGGGGSPVAIDEEDGMILSIEEDPENRKKNEHFIRKKQREIEEEKRLFYVAVTRAMDYLCMSGTVKGGKTSGRLAYLNDAFGIVEGSQTPFAEGPLPFDIVRESDIEARYRDAVIAGPSAEASFMEPAFVEPLLYTPKIRWRDVTEDSGTQPHITRHGEDWVIIGSLMHRVFEELSKGILREQDIEVRTEILLKTLGKDKLLKTILTDIEKLRASGLLKDIILPCSGSYAELPFVLEKGKSVFKGRIDRLIISSGTAHIYDYKTFPVKEAELAGLIEKYGFQMELYREAAERLFSLNTKAYLLFTHLPELVEI